MLASGTTSLNQFIWYFSYYYKYYILFILRTFPQGACWYLGQPLLSFYIALFLLPYILSIIPFEDINTRGMLTSGTHSPNHLKQYYSYYYKYYILFFLRTIQQGACWHLGQHLLIILYSIIPITMYIIYYS